jgi:hypothetical protein
MSEGGSITRTVFGTNLEEAEKIKIVATKGDYGITSPDQVVINGKDGGKKLNDYVASKEDDKKKDEATEITKVKEVTLKTSLDFGSANDGSGGQQSGMVHGKTYVFNAEYTDGDPKDKSSTKWMLKYHDLSKNDWVEKPLKSTGKTLNLLVDQEEMCGRFVYVRAYIKDAKTEGELKVWKHNRFRWFDRSVVEKEIKERTDNKQPWLVNQAGTSLCGMASIFYLFAKEQPENYKKFSKKLFRTGEATFNKYTVKPSEDLFSKKTNQRLIKGKLESFVEKTGYMPLIDYITLAGTRNTDNPSYKGGSETFQAINWPPIMTTLSEKLLGYSEVSSKGIYNPVPPLIYTSYAIENKIKDINEKFNAGYKLILMIDSDLIDDVWDYGDADLHWVVLESEIKEVQMLNKNGKIEYQLIFDVYTWGSNPLDKSRYLKRPMSKQHFMNNYNGYIKVK